MKRIVNGKWYDTDTAARVADGNWSYRGRSDDWSLYRTEKGNWFLVLVCNKGDSRLLVRTPDEVIDQLQRAGLYDVIEKYFDVEDA